MSERVFPKIFADTANLEALQYYKDLGILHGITTNPVIIAKEPNKPKVIPHLQKIVDLFPDIPLSIQLLDDELPVLIQTAHEYVKLSSQVVVKVPMFGDGRGLKVLRILTSEGIKTNVTTLMNAEQALMALMATNGTKREPTYLSLFFNRIKDGGGNPQTEITKTREYLNKFGFSSLIITGSIRHITDVYQAIIAGTHIVTIQPQTLASMIQHPESDRFINECQQQMK